MHLLIENDKFPVLKVIVEAYYLELDNETFYRWFTMESNAGLTPLDLSAEKGNEEIITYMFEIISKTDGKILKLDSRRSSIFHHAALKNKVFPILFFYEKLQVFFPEVKIIDSPNHLKITPLHYAVYNKNLQVVELLLDLGADINAQDEEGKNVLIYAVCSESLRLVKKLLLKGADKTLKDANGKTAYDVAIDKDLRAIAQVLENKSCFSKFLCNSFEFGSIQAIRNDTKTAYLFIVYYAFIGYYFLTYQEIKIRGSEELANFLRYTLVVSIGIALTCFSLAFFLFIYFTAIFQRNGNRKEVQQMGNTLIDLYKESKSICTKCQRTIHDHTIHCLVCDVCVDHWDHHCFWLNICIDISNKKPFQTFFFLLLIGVIVNVFFSGVYIAIILLTNEIDYAKLGLWGLFLLFFAYISLFVSTPLLCSSIKKKADINVTGSEIGTRLIDQSVHEKMTVSL